MDTEPNYLPLLTITIRRNNLFIYYVINICESRGRQILRGKQIKMTIRVKRRLFRVIIEYFMKKNDVNVKYLSATVSQIVYSTIYIVIGTYQGCMHVKIDDFILWLIK